MRLAPPPPGRIRESGRRAPDILLRDRRRARRATPARARAHPRVAVAQPADLSGRARLSAQPPARLSVAEPPDERPRDGCPVAPAAAGRARARLSQSRLARLRRCRADAAS